MLQAKAAQMRIQDVFLDHEHGKKMEEKVGEKGSRSSKFNSEIVRLEFV